MLKKQFRLRKQKDFENVFAKGAYFSDKFLTLKIVENGLDISRFGFIVGSKVSKKAVLRNRVKRVLRELVRLKLKQERIKTGFDAVFISKAGIAEIISKDINLAVEKLLKKSGLLENKSEK